MAARCRHLARWFCRFSRIDRRRSPRCVRCEWVRCTRLDAAWPPQRKSRLPIAMRGRQPRYSRHLLYRLQTWPSRRCRFSQRARSRARQSRSRRRQRCSRRHQLRYHQQWQRPSATMMSAHRAAFRQHPNRRRYPRGLLFVRVADFQWLPQRRPLAGLHSPRHWWRGHAPAQSRLRAAR